MNTFIARLLLVAAIAVVPGVDAVLHVGATVHGRVPAAGHEPSPSARPAPDIRPAANARAAGDRQRAEDLVERYERALVDGDWRSAFELLAPTSLTAELGLEAFASERAAFFTSAGDRYVLTVPVRVTDWASVEPLVAGARRARAWLIEVTYPALAGNNAGYEQFVTAPDGSGVWRIWPVR